MRPISKSQWRESRALKSSRHRYDYYCTHYTFYFCSYFSLLQLVPGVRGKSVLKELEAAIESLDHDLMRLEMQLVEQLDVSGQTSAFLEY